MKPKGYLLGIILGGFALILINSPKFTWVVSSGHMNTGHESLACSDCHLEAPGSYRQQLQANISYWLGKRAADVEFGYQNVTSRDCLACHSRPKDTHPIYRFFEPRFSKARLELGPQECVSCHSEHNGVRVTVDTNYCKVCHEKLKLKKDPLDISHADLIKEKRWESCLGCHDYHGNHKQKIATKLNEVIKLNTIEDYFSGMPSPYSAIKLYEAKKTRNES